MCRSHHAVDDFAQAIRAIGEPIHGRTADEISMAKLLTLLFEVTGLFDMATRTELVMLQKTMVVVEGVARNARPPLNMWKTAEPVVREWIERNLGPVGRIEEAGRGALGLAGLLVHIPSLVDARRAAGGHAGRGDAARLSAGSRERGRHRPGRGPARPLGQRRAVGRGRGARGDRRPADGVVLTHAGARLR